MTMASKSDFARSAADSVSRTDGDFTAFDSNSGYSDSTTSKKAWPTDYWFGKIYFKCTLAEAVAKAAHGSDGIDIVDARLQTDLRRYPHSEAYKLLCAENFTSFNDYATINGGDYYHKLMILIGMVIRIGPSDDKRIILGIIRSLYEPSGADSDDASSIGDELGQTRSSLSSFGDSRQLKDEEDESLPIYTSLLKEMGDKEGTQPVWEAKACPEGPFLRQTTCRYRGQTFDGFAKTSKESKHRSSKAAYCFFNAVHRK